MEIFYSIAFLWYPLIGCIIVLVFGVIFSFITGKILDSESFTRWLVGVKSITIHRIYSLNTFTEDTEE